jgi:hypothetical protein
MKTPLRFGTQTALAERVDISFRGSFALRLTRAVPVTAASQGIAITRCGIL